MPVDERSKDQHSNDSDWLDYDYDNALNGEWSFNIESSFIASATDNNETTQQEDPDTVVIDKYAYEELAATCEAMKIQMAELMKNLEQHKKENEEKDQKMARLESECEILMEMVAQEQKERNALNLNLRETTEKLENQEKKMADLVKKGTQKMDDLNAEKEVLEKTLADKKKEMELLNLEYQLNKQNDDAKFTLKVNELEDEARTLNRKYSNLKKRGVQMLDEKNRDIKRTQRELEEQKKKYEEQQKELDEMKSTLELETEKRHKFESEMKLAGKIVKDALKEEKRSRKLAEKWTLVEKTERMALEEKVMEMTSKGVIVHKSCPNSEHNLLVERIDVLHRQRDILVDSITQRDSGPEDH